MDKPARSPLACSFERHIRAENRSDARTKPLA
jgi:hypothetical protein